MPPAGRSAFRIQTRRDNGSVVVTLSGELDQETAPKLRSKLATLIPAAGSSSVVLDLAELTFVDSTGLATFAGAYTRLREQGGDLSVARASGPVSKALEITGLADILTVPAEDAGGCA